MEEDELIKNMERRSHLVILGAGATMEAIPKGDKNGRKSSVMNDFIHNIGLDDLLRETELNTKSNNLEAIYSELVLDSKHDDIRCKLEKRIFDYFNVLELPDTPTVYDYLLFSLRKKDLIASFNWDPLLIRAYNRVYKYTEDLPDLVFLHGNVQAGFCTACKRYGSIINRCPDCGGKFASVHLMFPVKDKDYTQDPFIQTQWNKVGVFMRDSALLTIFGYGAPSTDVEAIRLFKEAFGDGIRYLDYIEVIDKLKSHSQLSETWSYFGEHTNWGFKTFQTFFDSMLSEFPRRSVEGYTKRYIGGWWGSSSIILQKHNSMDELYKSLLPLIEDESKGIYNVR
jgi:hypothetical protein